MWIINKDNLHKIKNLDFNLPVILGVFLSLANPPFSFPYVIVLVFDNRVIADSVICDGVDYIFWH